MGDLAQATTLQGEAGRFTARLSRDWEIWGPNGGYLAAIALRAAGRVASIARPVSLHAHYLRVARFDEVEVEAQAIQAGQRAESIAVTLSQQGKLILSAWVRTAAVGEGLAHDATTPPQVADPEALPSAEDLRSRESPHFAFWDNYERRVLQPESWRTPPTAQPPHWLEWFRYRTPLDASDAFLDACRATVLIDTLCWPAAWRHHLPERVIAPSLDLMVWFHRPAQGEWLLAEARAPLSEAGLVSGTCSVWNQRRQLVASGGGQMLCVTRQA